MGRGTTKTGQRLCVVEVASEGNVLAEEGRAEDVILQGFESPERRRKIDQLPFGSVSIVLLDASCRRDSVPLVGARSAFTTARGSPEFHVGG